MVTWSRMSGRPPPSLSSSPRHPRANHFVAVVAASAVVGFFFFFFGGGGDSGGVASSDTTGTAARYPRFDPRLAVPDSSVNAGGGMEFELLLMLTIASWASSQQQSLSASSSR